MTDFTAQSCNVIDHFDWVREVFLVPYHILVILGILNIQPKNIERHIFLVEASLYTTDVVRADVVPAALVVTQRPVRRQWSRTRKATVLAEYIRRRRTRKDKEIEDARLRDPMCASRSSCWVRNIDPCLGADGIKDSNCRVSRVRMHDRDGAIKGSCRGSEVLEDISIIETIRITEKGVFSGSGRQVKRSGMLGNAVNVAVVRKINIEGQGFGT